MLELNGESLSLDQVERVAFEGESVSLAVDAVERMSRSRTIVEGILAMDKVVYGVNTGFGKLSDVRIPASRLAELQLNLVRSHACGVGDHLSASEARAMTLMRANVLAIGLSGARPAVAQALVEMLNKGVTPVIPEKGSVGASGDLAPLAHLALVAIGEGEAFVGGARMPGADALAWTGLEPLTLEAKEGLALLNGTQAICAIGVLAISRALRICHLATRAGAMSMEALLGTPAAFDERIHAARPQKFQCEVAEELRALLTGSEIRESHRENDPRVQDAYSLRCMPQVHGAALAAIVRAAEVLEIETGAATDNPLVFPNGDVISGGNFHGAPLALALDFAAIALTDLASMSERRIDRLVNPDLNEGLPPFLTDSAGTSSGYMIAHVTAVALLAECRVLCHPASVDNAPTSGGKEDHVSMGVTSALKLRTIVENVERIVAIEMLAAAEGLEYRLPLKPGRGVQAAYDNVRSVAPKLTGDRPLGPDIERLAKTFRMRPQAGSAESVQS
jgi:histidine ammonia-lyase